MVPSRALSSSAVCSSRIGTVARCTSSNRSAAPRWRGRARSPVARCGTFSGREKSPARSPKWRWPASAAAIPRWVGVSPCVAAMSRSRSARPVPRSGRTGRPGPVPAPGWRPRTGFDRIDQSFAIHRRRGGTLKRDAGTRPADDPSRPGIEFHQAFGLRRDEETFPAGRKRDCSGALRIRRSFPTSDRKTGSIMLTRPLEAAPSLTPALST